MTVEPHAPQLSDDALREAEEAIRRGIAARSTDGLPMIGFGELGVAVAWPPEAPVAVCKRQAPASAARVASDHDRMRAYEESLAEAGVLVLPTDLREVDRDDGSTVAYHVQPIIDRDRLVETILADTAPSPNHPIVLAIREAVVAAVIDTPALGRSIDAQVTNFAWLDDELVLLDTTPPLIWDESSGPFYDIGNYLQAIPRPLRPPTLRLTRRTGDIYRTVRGTLGQTVVYLHRIGQERWIDTFLAGFNEVLDEPLSPAEVERGYARMKRDLPLIKRIARVQRFWMERIRRRPYEFFITNSFTGEIL